MPPNNQADLFDDVDVNVDYDVDHSIAVKESSTKQAAHQLVDLFRKRTPNLFIDDEINNEYGNYLISEEQNYDKIAAGKETKVLSTVVTAKRETNAISCVETALNLVKDISDISEFNTVDIDVDLDVDIDLDIDHSIAMKESTEQAAHPFDSSYHPGHQQFQTSSSSSMIVGPIITEEEERHVQFAGEVVMHYPLLNGVFVDAVTVIDIPHVSDYTPEEKRTMWYTREEMIDMKQMCLHTVHDILTQHQQQYNCSIVESLYGCSFFLRGLERYVDHYQQSTMNKSTTTTRRRSGISCTGRQRSEQRQHQHPPSSKQRSPPHTDGGVASVLVEQYNQRLECLQAQGVVYGGILDPEQLRTVYETQGNTTASLHEAQQLAQQDETDVHEYCTTTELDDESLDSPYHDDDDNDNDNDNDDNDHYHYHRKNRSTNDNTIISNNIMMNHKKTAKLFDVLGVNKILHTLITPFIEVRLGDMVVGVDHHHVEWSF